MSVILIEDDRRNDEMKSYSGFKEVSSNLSKYQYKLVSLTRDSRGNIDAGVVPLNKEYGCKIYQDLHSKETEFMAQTNLKSDRILSEEEYKEYCKAVNNTYKVLEYLNSVNWKDLEVMSKSYS